MIKPIFATLALTITLAGCNTVRESRFNPLNWFGRSAPQPTTLAPLDAAPAVVDNRATVTDVTQMEVQRIQGGALVTAAGLPPTQGWWDAELVAENAGEPVSGVLTYRFAVAAPRDATRVSTPQSREVTAGIFVSDQKLEGVNRIVVSGTRNSRSVGR